MSIDLGPIYSHLNAGVEILLAGLALWLALRARAWVDAHISWLDADTRAKLQAQLEAVLNAGVRYALSELESLEASHPALKTPAGVKGWVTGKAGEYVVNHAEQELESVGWTPDEVAEKIVAKLPPANIMLSSASIAAGAPVEVRPLVPIEGAKSE
jgi:hypothetical protein